MSTRPGLLVKLSSEEEALASVQFYCSPRRLLAIVTDVHSDGFKLMAEIAGFENSCKKSIAYGHRSWVDEHRSLDLPAQERSLAWIGESSGLVPHLTLAQQLALARSWPEPAIDDTQLQTLIYEFELLGFLETKAGNLPACESLKAECILALVRKVDVILMHRPLRRLNNTDKQVFIRLLANLKSCFNGAVVMTHDDARDVNLFADELLLIIRGTSVSQTPVHEGLSHPATVSSARLLGYKNIYEAQVAAHLEKHEITLLTWGIHTLEVPLQAKPIGSIVDWLIPARAISVYASDSQHAPRANTFAGLVQKSTVLGDMVDVSVAIPLAKEGSHGAIPMVQIELPSHWVARHQVHIGSELRLHFPAQRIHCITEAGQARQQDMNRA